MKQYPSVRRKYLLIQIHKPEIKARPIQNCSILIIIDFWDQKEISEGRYLRFCKISEFAWWNRSKHHPEMLIKTAKQNCQRKTRLVLTGPIMSPACKLLKNKRLQAFYRITAAFLHSAAFSYHYCSRITALRISQQNTVFSPTKIYCKML